MTNAPGAAPTLIGLTEGDGFYLVLGSKDSLVGTVLTAELNPPGKHFEGEGGLELLFESAGVRFSLEIRYTENAQGIPDAESLDLRLVEGANWSIPIDIPITRVGRQS